MKEREVEAYQGYSKNVTCHEKDEIGRYLQFDSEYAYRFHFGRKKNWGATVVDFGGRIGEKTRKIDNVTVVEIDRTARKWMESHGIACKDGIGKFRNSSIDTIYCSHVLEHLESPIQYLEGFHSKLRPGGTLILVLPVEIGQLEPKTPNVDRHLYSWNFMNIFSTLKRVGFTPVEWKANPFPRLGMLKKSGFLDKIYDLEYLAFGSRFVRMTLCLAKQLAGIGYEHVIICKKA